MGPEEGILYADVALADLVSPKVVQDFAGHYNRFDLLQLSLTRRVSRRIEIADDQADALLQVAAASAKTLSEIEPKAAAKKPKMAH
jgi:hypothetical protein